MLISQQKHLIVLYSPDISMFTLCRAGCLKRVSFLTPSEKPFNPKGQLRGHHPQIAGIPSAFAGMAVFCC